MHLVTLWNDSTDWLPHPGYVWPPLIVVDISHHSVCDDSGHFVMQPTNLKIECLVRWDTVFYLPDDKIYCIKERDHCMPYAIRL